MNREVKIKRQNRKSLAMRVTPEGVMVFIPRWMEKDHPQVRDFIQDGLRKLEGRIAPEPPQQLTTPDEILAVVDVWAARIGVQPKRVRMRSMYTRWGSCSSRDSITLNRNLCYLPLRLVEYVVCHELVHLRVFNHSKAFWEMMGQNMPDWEARKQELTNWHF